MTPNDAQIDLLLRRYAGKAGEGAGVPDVGGDTALHLDADELNAFAEGALPPMARARYVSHLADCDQCRRLATQLAMAAGVNVSTADESTSVSPSASFWQTLKGLFTTASLRYAAFALVAITAVGITYTVLRRGEKTSLVADSKQVAPAQGGAVKPSDSAAEAPARPAQNEGTQPLSSASQKPDANKKEPVGAGDDSKTSDVAKETTAAKSAPVTEAKKSEADVAEAAPSYAPPPPGERVQSASREASNLKDRNPTAPAAPMSKQSNGGFGSFEQRNEQNRQVANDRARAGKAGSNQNDVGGTAQDEIASNRSRANQGIATARRREDRDKSKSDSEDQPRNQGATLSSNGPAERKAGGRTFRKQGSAWVDTKFKSSMPVTNISRGSDEFRALDSGLRSIAEQLGSEVVVVYKGRAYRIQ